MDEKIAGFWKLKRALTVVGLVIIVTGLLIQFGVGTAIAGSLTITDADPEECTTLDAGTTQEFTVTVSYDIGNLEPDELHLVVSEEGHGDIDKNVDISGNSSDDTVTVSVSDTIQEDWSKATVSVSIYEESDTGDIRTAEGSDEVRYGVTGSDYTCEKNPERVTGEVENEEGEDPSGETMAFLIDQSTEEWIYDEVSNDGLFEFTDNAFVEPGDFYVEINQQNPTTYWGYKEIHLNDGEDEFVNFERGGVYITDVNLQSPSGDGRYAPGGTISASVDVEKPRNGKNVKIEVYEYPSGESRGNTPDHIYDHGELSSGVSTLDFAFDAPNQEGDYEVDFIVKTTFPDADYISDYLITNRLNGPTIAVESYEPPQISDSSPSDSAVRIGKGDDTEFSASVSDPDTPTQDLQITWFVDGTQVKTGRTLQFEASEYTGGDHDIRVVATDGDSQTADASREWTVTILEPPTTQPNPTSNTVSVLDTGSQTFLSGASDPDTPTHDLEYTWKLDGTTVGSSSELSLNATEFTVGSHTLTLGVSDGDPETQDATDSWTVEIVAPPTIGDTQPQSQEVDVGARDSRTFSIDASDPDTSSNALQYNWYVDGELVDSGNTFEFEASDHTVATHEVEVEVSDDTPLTDDATRSWTVGIIEPPTIESTGPEKSTFAPGQEVTFTVDAKDPGGFPITSYTWNIASQQLQGDQVSQTFQTAGEKPVSVEVTNSKGVTTKKTFDINIEHQPPAISQLKPDETEITAGEKVTLDVEATDPTDRDTSFDYSWVIDGDEVLHKHSASVKINEVGTHSVDVTVENEYGAETQRSFSLSVSNDRPHLRRQSPTSDFDVLSETETPFKARITNNDTSNVDVSIRVDGETRAQDSIESREADISYSHTFSEPGSHRVTFSARDGHGMESTLSWDVFVKSRPPEVERWTPEREQLSILSGETINFNVSATDPEGEHVSYEWYIDGNYVAEGENYTASFDEHGEFSVVVKAKDPEGSTATHNWGVDVDSFQEPPSISNHSTKQLIDPKDQPASFLSLTLHNPGVNNRTARVSFIMTPQSGISYSTLSNVYEASPSKITGYSIVHPKAQEPMGIGINIRDESLYGKTISIPYEIRYHPENISSDYTVIENKSIEVQIKDPSAQKTTQSDTTQTATHIDTDTTTTTSPGFSHLQVILGVLIGSILVGRIRREGDREY